MPMTKAHKAALARGRNEGRAVKAYLMELESSRPGRGRRRKTPDTINRQLAEVETALDDATSLKRVQLLQRRNDLWVELDKAENGTTGIEDTEPDFINAVKSYSESKGISYATWREAGVPASVLRSGGMH